MDSSQIYMLKCLRGTVPKSATVSEMNQNIKLLAGWIEEWICDKASKIKC